MAWNRYAITTELLTDVHPIWPLVRRHLKLRLSSDPEGEPWIVEPRQVLLLWDTSSWLYFSLLYPAHFPVIRGCAQWRIDGKIFAVSKLHTDTYTHTLYFTYTSIQVQVILSIIWSKLRANLPVQAIKMAKLHTQTDINISRTPNN